MGELALSHKVSVDSVVETDDVLVEFIDVVFKRNSIRSWLVFSIGLAVPSCLTIACWLDGRYLAATIFSTTALGLVIFRIVGLSREKPAEQIEQPDELQAHTYARTPHGRLGEAFTPMKTAFDRAFVEAGSRARHGLS